MKLEESFILLKAKIEEGLQNKECAMNIYKDYLTTMI